MLLKLMPSKRIVFIIIVLLLSALLIWFYFSRPDCATLLTPQDVAETCGITLGTGVKTSGLTGAGCSKYWEEYTKNGIMHGGELKILSIILDDSKQYETALTFHQDLSRQKGYADYVVTETDEFGRAAYILETSGVNNIMFLQGSYSVRLHSFRDVCNLEQLKILGHKVEERIS